MLLIYHTFFDRSDAEIDLIILQLSEGHAQIRSKKQKRFIASGKYLFQEYIR